MVYCDEFGDIKQIAVHVFHARASRYMYIPGSILFRIQYFSDQAMSDPTGLIIWILLLKSAVNYSCN